MQSRAIEEPAQRPVALYSIYDQLQHAATKAGVPKENLRRQLWNEYVKLKTCIIFFFTSTDCSVVRFGCDPLRGKPPTPRTSREAVLVARREEMARQQFKADSLEMMRSMLQQPETRNYVRVDSQGEPVWDEAVNGRYAVLVTKLKKGGGLEELETW